MGVRAVENLRKETHCQLDDCAAVVFVASSLFAPAVAGDSPHRKQDLPQVWPGRSPAISAGGPVSPRS